MGVIKIPASVFICTLPVLLGNSPSRGCSQTCPRTLRCIHLDLCLQRVSVLMPHQAPAAQRLRSDSAPPAVTQTSWYNHQLCCSAQKPASSARIMPKALSASSSSSLSLQRWACKTADPSFHTPLSSSLSCFYPSASFFQTFKSFSDSPTLQDEIPKLRCFELFKISWDGHIDFLIPRISSVSVFID